MSEDLEHHLAAARERVRELGTNCRGGTVQARRAAWEQQLQAERDLAAARGEPYATVIDIGPHWDAGAPLPHLISNGSRVFAVCRASQPDPDWDGTYVQVVSSADPQSSLFVVIEIWGCAETRFGGPNDEAMGGHPLYGKGLVGYEAHEVVNSAWIEEAIAVNSVHPDHSDAPFRQLHHYALLFHDEMLEVLARGIQARYVTGTMGMILGNLCDSLVEQTYRADLPRGAGKASDRPGRTGPDFWARRNWLICAQPSGRPVSEYGPDLAGYACERVAELVSSSMSLGVPRREYSLASKVLHWLMPWRVPVYDSFVRDALGVPKGWDHPQAYRKIAAEVFPMARTMTGNPGWIGSLEPRSPLRALDKLAWWLGGGSTGAAAEVHDPWKVPRLLGLDCP